MKKDASPWSMPVAVEDVPETGLQVVIEAPAEARAAVAKLAAVREIPQLAAEFDLVRRGAGVHVTGRVRARVGQTCVVTLDPIENLIDEAVDVVFAPGTANGPLGDAVELKSLEGADEAPELLIDGKLDLGAVAVEFLMLGIDPYPRKPGAEFTPPKVEESGEHPFAALAELKRRSGSPQS